MSLTHTHALATAPGLAALAGDTAVSAEGVSRRAKELAARVKVGAIRTFVSTVQWHFQLRTANLCKTVALQKLRQYLIILASIRSAL